MNLQKYWDIDDSYKFNLLRNDPLMRIFNNIRKLKVGTKKRKYIFYVGIFLFYFIALVLVPAVLNYFNDTLVSKTFIADLKSDLLCSWALHSIFEDTCENLPYTYNYVFLRDILYIAIMTIISAHCTLLVNKWYNMSTIFENLYAKNTVNNKIVSKEKFYNIMENRNKIANNILINVGALILAIICCFVFLEALHENGMLSAIIHGQDPNWNASIYRHWWANGSGGVFDAIIHIYFILVGSLAIYYVFMHNYYGIILISIFIQLLLIKKRNPKKGHLLVFNVKDKSLGLGQGRTILVQVGLSITAMLFVIILLAGYCHFNIAEPNIYWLFLGIWIVLNPIYFLYPNIRIHFLMKKFKNDSRKRILGQMKRYKHDKNSTKYKHLKHNLVVTKLMKTWLLEPQTTIKFTVTMVIQIVLFLMKTKSLWIS